MNFPFTFHSNSDHRLVCINLNDEYHIEQIEIWDAFQNCWKDVSPRSDSYNDLLSDFKEELSGQEKQGF